MTIFYSDIWTNACMGVDFQLAQCNRHSWMEGQEPNFYLAGMSSHATK